jgi:tryptophanyl-tRNA synthetase
VYSSADTQAWAAQGCRNAEFGCITCKQPVIDSILREQQPMLERAAPYVANPQRVIEIVEAGTQRARQTVRETMVDVRTAMGLNY